MRVLLFWFRAAVRRSTRSSFECSGEVNSPCGGSHLLIAAKGTLLASGKFLPWQVVTITTSGERKL